MGQHKGSPCSALGQVVENRSLEVLGGSLARMDHTQSPEAKQLSLELSRGYDFFFHFIPLPIRKEQKMQKP